MTTPATTPELIPVCDACLRFRRDVDAAWLAEAAAGNKVTQYWCDDDLAFPALASVTATAACPHCRNSSQIIPLDRPMALRLSIFRIQLEAEAAP